MEHFLAAWVYLTIMLPVVAVLIYIIWSRVAAEIIYRKKDKHERQ